jgi:hypothetical protein
MNCNYFGIGRVVWQDKLHTCLVHLEGKLDMSYCI